MARRGMGRGRGKGFKNIIPKLDSRTHSNSARGIKQPQRCNLREPKKEHPAISQFRDWAEDIEDVGNELEEIKEFNLDSYNDLSFKAEELLKENCFTPFDFTEEKRDIIMENFSITKEEGEELGKEVAEDDDWEY